MTAESGYQCTNFDTGPPYSETSNEKNPTVIFQMLNLDLLANGDNRRVNQESIDRAMQGLTKSRKEFISSCLEKDPSKRVTASALMKSKVLQEVL